MPSPPSAPRAFSSTISSSIPMVLGLKSRAGSLLSDVAANKTSPKHASRAIVTGEKNERLLGYIFIAELRLYDIRYSDL